MRRPVPLLLVFAFVLAACGASAREKTITATYTATVAAHKGFLAYDKSHEAAIVDAAASLAAGQAALAEWRTKSDRVAALFDATYRAIAAAAVLADDPRSFANLVEASHLLTTALRDLTGGKLP